MCVDNLPPPPPNLLGKMHKVIHLLTGAEKQVQLDTLISPLLAGLVPAATWSPLAEGQLFLFEDLMGGMVYQPEGQAG